MGSRGKKRRISYRDIGIALIIFGSAVIGVGIASCAMHQIGRNCFFSINFFEILGGILVLALGFVMMELELLRQEKSGELYSTK